MWKISIALNFKILLKFRGQEDATSSGSERMEKTVVCQIGIPRSHQRKKRLNKFKKLNKEPDGQFLPMETVDCRGSSQA
jgi:hypothetical protein